MIDYELNIDQNRKHSQVDHTESNIDKKRKVLFVIDTLQFGGAEQSLLVNTTSFKMIEPVVCHLYKGEALKKEFQEKGIRVYSLNINKKYGFITAYKQLSEIVKIEKPSLLVAYLTRSEIVARFVGKHCLVPVIGSFVSDLYGKTYNQHLSWRAKQLVSLFKLINKLTSHYCIGFVANSHTIKQTNTQQLSIADNRVKVINRGRDSYKFKTKSFLFHNTSNSIHFLNIGRLFPIKGQRELILGFKKFIETYPHATLSIIGDGPLRCELKDLIQNVQLEEKVFLLGSRDDIPSIISEYDCFVFPSQSEGFSGAVVEAIFAGLPVLASDIPANLEVISHMQSGFLFQAGSVDNIAKAMEWFKDNRVTATFFAKNAFNYAKENFELENTIRQLEGYLCTKIMKEN